MVLSTVFFPANYFSIIFSFSLDPLSWRRPLNGRLKEHSIKETIWMYHYLHFFNLSFFINLTLWTLHFSEMCTWVSLENENSYAKFLFISRLCLRGKCIFSQGQPIVSFPLLLSTFSSTTPEEVVFWSFCKRLRRQRGKRGFENYYHWTF